MVTGFFNKPILKYKASALWALIDEMVALPISEAYHLAASCTTGKVFALFRVKANYREVNAFTISLTKQAKNHILASSSLPIGSELIEVSVAEPA